MKSRWFNFIIVPNNDWFDLYIAEKVVRLSLIDKEGLKSIAPNKAAKT